MDMTNGETCHALKTQYLYLVFSVILTECYMQSELILL